MRMMMVACWVFVPCVPTVSKNTDTVLHLRVSNGGTHGFEDTEKLECSTIHFTALALQNPRNARISIASSCHPVSGPYIWRGCRK